MNKIYKFGNLHVSALDEWMDITDYSNNEMPFTLAKKSGTGAFQFSGANYKSGNNPNITLFDLIEMHESFASKRSFDDGFDEFSLEENIIIFAKSYHHGNDYVRIWYCSDGLSVFLITYLSDWGAQGDEPDECNRMVLGVSFDYGK
ncbi:hypothetical protein [Luteolibacter sp. LG18]|uniref:hypothetical protein n=1 Tax=Luteolibacter sp. LG18 TaxID=2819286 RepID=UPI002B30F338|nr:hypothetical protein llg_32730 [Luteolibacter sp. LG18]